MECVLSIACRCGGTLSTARAYGNSDYSLRKDSLVVTLAIWPRHSRLHSSESSAKTISFSICHFFTPLRTAALRLYVDLKSARQRETPRMAGSYFANACSVFSWLAHCLRLKFCGIVRKEKGLCYHATDSINKFIPHPRSQDHFRSYGWSTKIGKNCRFYKVSKK